MTTTNAKAMSPEEYRAARAAIRAGTYNFATGTQAAPKPAAPTLRDARTMSDEEYRAARAAIRNAGY